MNSFKDKSIIVAVPNHFGLPEIFKKNLEFLGFKVFLVKHDNAKVKLSTEESLIHIYNKTFNNNKTFKARISAEKKELPQLSFLENIDKADYALVIRPDLFSKNVLAKIREKSSFASAYQWDGMCRYPLSESIATYFDNFFVFDKEDTLKYPKSQHIPNFYFDYFIEDNSDIEQDVFFVGTFMKDRINELVKLSENFEQLGLKSNINIIYNKERHIEKYLHYPINFTKTGMSFEDNMKNAKASRIILDFQNSSHKGLSFRSFEAIGFRKKMITNNSLVKRYDFYNPNNIFVLNNNNIQEIKDFLENKYKELPNDIYEKYSFSNWIKKVLNTTNLHL